MLHQASPNFCQAQDPEDLQHYQMRLNINKFWKLLVRIMPREKNVLKFLFPLEKIEIYIYNTKECWIWCYDYDDDVSFLLSDRVNTILFSQLYFVQSIASLALQFEGQLR